MRYFRFTWQVKMSPFTEEVGTGISPVIIAKTEEEARAIFNKMLLEDDETPIAEPKMEELTLDQCIEEEEEEIRSKIRYSFILQQHGMDVSVRQFSNLNQELKGRTEAYWAALKEANRVLRLLKLAHRKLDLDKVTVLQLQECLLRLSKATTPAEFDEIWDALPKKSGG